VRARAICETRDRAQPSAEATLLRDLTAYSARCRGTRPIRASVIRFDAEGYAWLMSKPETGWASFGLRYASLREIARDWSLRFVSAGRDEHSAFIQVEPA
jgi:hypothetical protein